MKNISAEHLVELQTAKQLLENPGFAIKVSNLLGKPIEKGVELLPSKWQERVGDFTRDALMMALQGALLTMGKESSQAYPLLHKAAATASGAMGGFFGLPALAIELPVSTTIMCRSIADIARLNGEDLNDYRAKLACIEVFAFGGSSSADDSSEAAYFAARAALANAIAEAVEHLANRKIAEEAMPAILRLIGLVASRFQIQVTEKAAAQTLPVIGAVFGGAINLLFIDHFQNMSKGHFAVRRLERLYGQELVKLAYERISLPKNTR